MKRLHALLVLTVFLGGCVSAGITPPEEVTGKLNEVYIVAMEPHPLGVPPKFRSVILGSGGSVASTRGFAPFNTTPILLESPEASKRGGQTSRSFQAALDQKGAWVPTIVLANETLGQLTARGIQASVAPQVKPIPGMRDRSYTMLMENWLAPIRHWYNDTKPVTDYQDLRRDKGKYVLEVGIINYEIASTNGGLLVQVAMKLIDPTNGNVIGRARAANSWNITRLGSLEKAFSGDAGRFKEAFIATGKELTRKCLAEPGLIRPGRE